MGVKRVTGVMLNWNAYGTPAGRPLIIAHGLYGSARNWSVIAKRLGDARHVIAVDMRNHGDSPWSDRHDYDVMAEDLAEVIGAVGGEADVCGHSMGGKAAMVLALRYPNLLGRLIVADIAPVSYTHSQLRFAEAMMRVDLTDITRRSDVVEQLAALGVERELQSFFTQSVDVKNRRWQLNLKVLAQEMPKIMGFPATDTVFEGATFFLTGANSDYVTPTHRSRIKALFPRARFAKLADAGHWLHAEKPRAFEASVRAFLERN